MRPARTEPSLRLHRSARFEVAARLALVLVLAMNAACVHGTPRTQRTSWEVRGRVLSISGSALQVRHTSGQIYVVSLDDRTVCLVNHQPGSLRAVHEGTRVTLDVEHLANGSLRATRVEVFR